MWHGLRTIMDDKVKDIAVISADSAFAYELKVFYACFETTGVASANYSLTRAEGDVMND